MSSTAALIMQRVSGHGRGAWVCSAKDFLDLGSRAAVDQALCRLAKSGTLRRVGRGLYDWPRVNTLLKTEAPATLAGVVAAVARRDATAVMPDNLVAANGLGLTNAVPSRPVYLTTGRSKTIKAGGWTVQLKHAPSKLMAWRGSPAQAVVQCMYWLGEDLAKSSDSVAIICNLMTEDVRTSLCAGMGQLPTWAVPIARRLVGEHADGGVRRL